MRVAAELGEPPELRKRSFEIAQKAADYPTLVGHRFGPQAETEILYRSFEDLVES